MIFLKQASGHALTASETMTDIGQVVRRIDVCQGKQNK